VLARNSVLDLVGAGDGQPTAVERLITHTFSRDDTDQAFERVPGQIKAIVQVRSPGAHDEIAAGV
jgi:hypothetical protein